MDAIFQARAEQLATEFAQQHHTAEDLNGLIRLMMKTALERMLNTELDKCSQKRRIGTDQPASNR